MLNISSLGGFMGGELSSLYCASKFGLEGFSECLGKEVAPFGITVTVVEPGPFRTDFLSSKSLTFNGTPIDDYERRRATVRDALRHWRTLYRDAARPHPLDRRSSLRSGVAPRTRWTS